MFGLPVEVAMIILKECLRDQVIELDNLFYPPCLVELIAANKSLSILAIDEELAESGEKLLYAEAIFKPHSIECLPAISPFSFTFGYAFRYFILQKFPQLKEIRRLHIDPTVWNFFAPNRWLNMLPALKTVTFLIKNVRDASDSTRYNNIDSWIDDARGEIDNEYLDLRTMAQPGHGFGRHLEVLDMTFSEVEGWYANGCKSPLGAVERQVCHTRITDGRIIELDAPEDTRNEWRDFLIEDLIFNGGDGNFTEELLEMYLRRDHHLSPA